MQDLRQSDNWARFMKSLGWEKVFLGDGVGIGYLRKFLGIFTIIKIQRPRKLLDEKEIDALARKNKAILVKIEPKQGEIGEAQPRSYRIGTIVGALKGMSSQVIGKSIWQQNFYEHIIRSESSLDRIRNYILRNPQSLVQDWSKIDPKPV